MASRFFPVGMRKSLALVVIAVAALSSIEAQAHEDLLSPDGYGWVRIGDSFSQTRKPFNALIDRASRPTDWFIAGPGDDPDVCVEYELLRTSGILVMFEQGKVTRVSLTKPEYATDKGLQVGDPESKVLAAHPDVVIEPAPYGEEPAHDLYVWRTSGRGLRFEIDADGKVAAIHGGGKSIRYMEGCL